MFVVVIFPVSFVAMPIPIVMAMPVFVIPIVVPAVLVSSDREPRFQLLTRGRGWIKAMSSFQFLRRPGETDYSGGRNPKGAQLFFARTGAIRALDTDAA